MSPHVTSPSPRQKLNVFHLILLSSLLIVCGIGAGLSTAQAPLKEEREVEDKIPKHLPIKVKIKNLEKAKDLKNDQWMRDIEIEVQNTGNKPIYYLRLTLYFVDVKLESGDKLGFPLSYGRAELVDFDKRATPDDVPIKPGETYVFQSIKKWAGRWETFRATRKMPQPTKVGFQFEILSYGDGTGFTTTGGLPVSHEQSFTPH